MRWERQGGGLGQRKAGRLRKAVGMGGGGEDLLTVCGLGYM